MRVARLHCTPVTFIPTPTYTLLASSDNLLFLLNATDPQTPHLEKLQQAEEPPGSVESFQVTPEEQQWSHQHAKNSPEMDTLKRRLSSTRRLETTNRNLIPELNQYKQNNVALQ
jgi:hypothetical protein